MFLRRSLLFALLALTLVAPAHAQIYADADTTFYIGGDQDGLTLYGGFEGTETDADERAPQEHRVILSADIGQDDTDPDGDNVIEDAADVNGTNSKQVMVLDGTVGGGITRSTLISGVVMTAGRARGPDPRAQRGGGLYCAGGDPDTECSPRLHGIVFAGNATTVAKGGALYNDGDFGTAEPYVKNAVFVGNSVENSGGAIHNNGGTVEITGATFTDNTAGVYGGAIYNAGINQNQGMVTVANSILSNPVVQRATVRYGVPESVDSTVRLRLYDVLGRRVRTVAARAEAGRHEQTLDVGDLPSGVYVLRLSAGGQSVTRKLTVIR